MTNLSATTTANLTKFQGLLRELFQFDCADLDFGIYRIMNHKQKAIEQFISKQLPATIATELDKGPLAQQAQAEAKLAEIGQRIRSNVDENAIDDEGNLVSEHYQLRVGKEYLEAQRQVADGSRSRDSVEASIYNRLYTFFSRYYEDGDFISKRRYSRNQRYAIPYNGEEVHLHWANNDQYYVKSDEYFRNYDWRAPNGVVVQFRLKNANVEQNNVKGDRRFFIPRVSETEWDPAVDAIMIPFEYRPLSGQEANSYGTQNQQDKIIAEAISTVGELMSRHSRATTALEGEHRRYDKDSASPLEHHLRQYVRRNNSDFFIHKDLTGFLDRELDFYLKNEVLNLENIVTAGQDMTEGWFQQLRLTKAIGKQIIDLLAQIENFQKMLWEKRKFVTETQYCIVVGKIDESFYPKIAACEPQWAEWKNLVQLDEERSDLFTPGESKTKERITFLDDHPSLPLDTKHFPEKMVDLLLATFKDLDECTDGLLVHSENFQALSLLNHHFRSSVKVAYYDPPYNTSEETFVYKNNYRHSSWLSMMYDRIAPLLGMLSSDGIVLLAIDDEEVYRLKLAMDQVLGEENFLGSIVVQSNPRGRGISSYYATSHDYYLVYAAEAEQAIIVNQPLTEDQAKEFRHSDEESRYRLLPFRRSGGLSTPDERPNSEFTLYFSQSIGRIFGVGGDRKQPYPAQYEPISILCATKDTFEVSEIEPAQFWKTAPKDTVAILPVDSDESRRVWRWSNRYKILEAAHLGEFVVQTSTGRDSVLLKDRMKDGRKPKTVWSESKYDASSHGTNLLQDILGGRGLFGYPKSLFSTRDAIHSVAGNDRSAVIIDMFAGSGTTGHAVMQLNREDGGRRKFILAEMGQYFDAVLLPRIKKIVYSPEWKNGKPKGKATEEETLRGPRIVKYIRLESYEDALDGIELEQSSNQMELADTSTEYLLKYMLKWETKGNETLLNVANLARRNPAWATHCQIHSSGIGCLAMTTSREAQNH